MIVDLRHDQLGCLLLGLPEMVLVLKQLVTNPMVRLYCSFSQCVLLLFGNAKEWDASSSEMWDGPAIF